MRAGLLAELAHHRVQRADALDRARRAVVHDERDLLGVEHLVDAHALERLDGQRRRAVLAHHEVDVGDDDVAGVRVSSECAEKIFSAMVLPASGISLLAAFGVRVRSCTVLVRTAGRAYSASSWLARRLQ